jgi:putative endonuclease
MNTGAYLYILRCADGKYYVGTTRKSLDKRLGGHNAGLHVVSLRRDGSAE